MPPLRWDLAFHSLLEIQALLALFLDFNKDILSKNELKYNKKNQSFLIASISNADKCFP
jgi:hypothetical protein